MLTNGSITDNKTMPTIIARTATIIGSSKDTVLLMESSTSSS